LYQLSRKGGCSIKQIVRLGFLHPTSHFLLFISSCEKNTSISSVCFVQTSVIKRIMLYIRLRRKQKYQVTNVDAKSGNQNATGSEIQELSWKSTNCKFLLNCENSLQAECGLGRVGWAESDLVTRGCYMESLADSTLYARGILHFSLSSKVNTNPAVNCRGYTGTVFMGPLWVPPSELYSALYTCLTSLI